MMWSLPPPLNGVAAERWRPPQLMSSSPTLGTALDQLAQRFAAAELSYGHGTDNAWDEAVYLLLSLTGWPDDQSVQSRQLPAALWQSAQELAQRRIDERVPLVYLLGRCRYLNLEFAIEPGLVVPRSPIGLLLADHFEDWIDTAPRRILDLGTGTGCLGIVAALLFPEAELTLVDVDPLAVATARLNASQHGLRERTQVIAEDAVAYLQRADPYDLILCNPPYVNDSDMVQLPPEYRHEPVHGLAAGVDGLALMLPLLAELPDRLSATGLFLGEVGRSEAALRACASELPLHWLGQDGDAAEGQAEGVFLIRGVEL